MGLPIVLLISYHFPPDGAIGGARAYRFQKYLKRLGYECHVITAANQEQAASTDVEYVADALVSGPFRRSACRTELILQKLFLRNGFRFWWSVSAFRAGRLFLKRRKDEEIVILSSAPPVGAHLIAMGLAALSGRRWIADFRDPFYPVGGDAAFFGKIIAPRLERLVLKRADCVLAITDAMHQVWRDRYPSLDGKINTLWSGFDSEDTITTYALPERQVKVLSHVGELYGGRNIRPLLNAMKRLLASGRIPGRSVVIRQVGAAEQGDLLEPEALEAAQAEGWLEMAGPVPAREARSMALDSDGLLLIQPQSAVQVPGKLFEYLRLGRPIFAYVVRDSPAERILQRAGVPFKCIYPEDAAEVIEQQLLSFIAMLDGHPISYSQWFADSFDAARQAGDLDVLIRSLMDDSVTMASTPSSRPGSLQQ